MRVTRTPRWAPPGARRPATPLQPSRLPCPPCSLGQKLSLDWARAAVCHARPVPWVHERRLRPKTDPKPERTKDLRCLVHAVPQSSTTAELNTRRIACWDERPTSGSPCSPRVVSRVPLLYFARYRTVCGPARPG